MRPDPVRTDRCRPRRQGLHPVVGLGLDCSGQLGWRVALMRTAAPRPVLPCGMRQPGQEIDAARYEALAGNPIRLPRGSAPAAHARYSITFAAESISLLRRSNDGLPNRQSGATPCSGGSAQYPRCGRRFRLEPIAALIDAWIFARQMDQLFRDGAGAGAFGTFQPEAVEISRRLADQMREIGGSIAVSPETRPSSSTIYRSVARRSPSP